MTGSKAAEKLAIGTVQFGIQYGISNNLGVPDDGELYNILDIAYESGISVLDCAPAYGNAEDRIGNLSENRFKVVTKFANVADEYSLNNSLEQSLKRLRSEHLYAYIAHNSAELISNPRLWEFLISERDKGRIQKVGYSLYTPEQLEQLLSLNMVPDIVQLPYNLFDRKFENYLAELNKYRTEIHVRSVFLQGLFFMNPDNLPVVLQKLKPAVNSIHTLCKEMDMSIAQLALSFVNDNPFVDKILVGVVTSDQLRQNICDIESGKFNSHLMGMIDQIEITDQALLNPSNWG